MILHYRKIGCMVERQRVLLRGLEREIAVRRGSTAAYSSASLSCFAASSMISRSDWRSTGARTMVAELSHVMRESQLIGSSSMGSGSTHPLLGGHSTGHTNWGS